MMLVHTVELMAVLTVTLTVTLTMAYTAPTLAAGVFMLDMALYLDLACTAIQGPRASQLRERQSTTRKAVSR